MKKKKRSKYIIMIVVVLIVIVGGIFMAFQLSSRKITNKNKVLKLVNQRLNSNLDEYVDDVTGEITREYGEKYVTARMRINKQYLDQVISLLEKVCWKESIEDIRLPYYLKNELVDELSEKEILYYFNRATEGRRVKTIEVDVYIAEGSDGTVYLYIFG